MNNLNFGMGEPIGSALPPTAEELAQQEAEYEKYNTRRIREYVAIELIRMADAPKWTKEYSEYVWYDIPAFADPIVQYIINGPKE